MRCPKCASEKVHIVETTNTTQSSGYSCGKGCCGALLFGNILGALCGIGGKTKTNTEHISYWLCDSCGAKFQHGMTEQMFEFKNRMDNYHDPLKFVKLDDSTEQLYKIRISLNHFKTFPDIWECISFDGKVGSLEMIKILGILMFKGKIPDIVCCMVAKKSSTKKKISDIFSSTDSGITISDNLNQEPDYGWDLSLYSGIVMLKTEFLYYDGNQTFHWYYEDIDSIQVTEKDIIIYNPESSQRVSFKNFIEATRIKGDAMRAFVRFLQGTLTDNAVYSSSGTQEVNNTIGKNNKASLMHSGNLYVFTESSSLLENRSTLLEINTNGQYYSFPLHDRETVFHIDSDERYLYFRSQDRLSKISWENIKNRVTEFEDIISQEKIEDFTIVDDWLYYIMNKHMWRKNLERDITEEVISDIECKAPMIKGDNKLYFINASERKKLYRLDLQNQKIERVMDEEKIGNYTICRNRVFYQKGMMDLDFKMFDIETNEKRIVEEMVTGFNSTEDKLYYHKDNFIVQYTVSNENRKPIALPKDISIAGDFEVAGDLICCKARGSISLNYVINVVTGDGQEL